MSWNPLRESWPNCPGPSIDCSHTRVEEELGGDRSFDDKLMSANKSSIKADSEIYWNPFINITHSVSILIQ